MKNARKRGGKLNEPTVDADWGYQPPPDATEELPLDMPLGGGHLIKARYSLYRGLYVDFAFMALWEPHEDEEPDEIHRIDCAHSEIHGHQFFQRADREPERYLIRPIIEGDSCWDSWRCIHESYDECSALMVENYQRYWDRWRS